MQIRQLKITNFRGSALLGKRFLAIAIAILTLCAVSFFPEPVSAQPLGSAEPLTAEEMVAITKEADERRQKFSANREEPLAPPWENLTRDKLARLIASPQFQKLPYPAHGLLLDQALAWDLVHFQNLSDIKQFFQRVNGKRYFPEPDPSARSVDSSRIGYVSEASASAEGGALSALTNCTPWAMWVFESQDPVLWALQRYTSLQEIANFGWCVRKQRDGRPTPDSSDPDSARGAKSAVIIADRLSRQLLNHGCSGTGPDQCLGLLLLLRSLKPDHPDLAAILRRLDAETEATKPEDIPTGLTGVQGLPHDSLNAQYEKIQQRLWRKGIVVSAKLDHMLSHPQEWTKAEIEYGVDAAVSLMLEGGRISFLKFPHRYLPEHYYIAHPWDHLQVHGAMPAIVAQRLQQLAGQTGALPGCEFGKLAPYSPLPEYWYAYALTKLQRENLECGALPLDWVAAQYISASKKSQRELLDPIAALAPRLSENADPVVRDAIRSRIENHCPATNWGGDYWGICSRHAAAIEAEIKRKTAEEAAQREAQERKAQALQNDPCTNGTAKALLLKFGYGDAEDFPTNGARVSCKQLPNVPGSAALAVFHLTHSDNPDDPSDDSGDYDLHLILTDNKGHIKAQTHEKKAAHSDAVRLDSVAIDTGLYILAPKVRAIGVSTYNAAHCYQCAFSETNLSLFVQSGKKLRKVWSGLLHTSGNDDDLTNEGCTSPTKETRKYLSMGTSTHSGYADLVITTVTFSTAGYNQSDENQKCSGGTPKQRSTETWIYDGSKYMSLNKKAQKN